MRVIGLRVGGSEWPLTLRWIGFWYWSKIKHRQQERRTILNQHLKAIKGSQVHAEDGQVALYCHIL